MVELTIVEEMELQSKLNKEIWEKYNVVPEVRFNEKIVVGDEDKIVKCLEIIIFKEEVDKHISFPKFLWKLLLKEGFNFVTIKKDVWLGDNIRYKYYFN